MNSNNAQAGEGYKINSKRVYDRHSGTGRGKEISKGGAGGHHTWGMNPHEIAREAEKHEDIKDYDENLSGEGFQNDEKLAGENLAGANLSGLPGDSKELPKFKYNPDEFPSL